MRPSFACRTLAAALLVGGVAGCELLKHNEEALATINKRVIGMPAGEFFDRYGRAQSRSEGPDGSMDYEWTSAVPYAKAGPDSLDERICTLRIGSDARGRIARVAVVYDAPGRTSTSRCREIFAAP
jgi:hypothetical protein